MKITQKFRVDQPLSVVWDALDDVSLVAQCRGTRSWDGHC